MGDKIKELENDPYKLKELGKSFKQLTNKKEVFMAMKLHKLRY